MTSFKVAALTGRPGIGKTTALMKVVEMLKRDGHVVGGFYTREVRSEGIRKGFEIVDIFNGESVALAGVGGFAGPRVGKYVVFVENLEKLGVGAVLHALEKCEAVFVDEVGPMELLSNMFVGAVEKVLASGKPSVFTVHYSAKHSIVQKVKNVAGSNLFVLDEANRGTVPSTVHELVKKWLRS